MRVVVVVAGGDVPSALPQMPANSWVIGVDSGVGHALRLGLTVHEAIGDFDSIAPGHLARIQESGAIIERHPQEKNATDLELALEAAIRRQPSRIMVIGGHGGRADHHLANLLILASSQFASWPIVAYMGDAVVTVVRRQARLEGRVGDIVSLLPVHGNAEGVITKGLRYPLENETLLAGSTRGVSNIFESPLATVTLRAGTLLAIRPHATPPSSRG